MCGLCNLKIILQFNCIEKFQANVNKFKIKHFFETGTGDVRWWSRWNLKQVSEQGLYIIIEGNENRWLLDVKKALPKAYGKNCFLF